MRPFNQFYLYRTRLRVHAAREALAALGVATAVGLVFASLVANGSVTSSADDVVHAVVGPASLQVRARDDAGFDQRLLARVERLPGVQRAAPLLEQTATIKAPGGRQVTVDIAGTTVNLAILNGLARTLPVSALSPKGIGLSRAAADRLGMAETTLGSQRVTIDARGHATSLKVSAVLGSETFGALAHARVAVMPLLRLQQLAGLPRRISRILVEPRPGRQAAVRRELLQLAARRLTVAPATQDETLLRQALGPSNQASALFAAISALLGFLIAFTAILMTVPDRRQSIADLRVDGVRRPEIVQMVLAQALLLGLVASGVGLVAGYILARGLFHQSPGYLAQAFTLGTRTTVGAWPLVLAVGGGLLATALASGLPLLDLRRGRALDAVRTGFGVGGNGLSAASQRRLSAAAVGLLALASALFALQPSAAIAACLLLAVATLLGVPLALSAVLRAAQVLSGRYERLTLLPVALASLRATTLSSLALAATGAVALFGSVALGGSRGDLLRGIAGYTRHYVSAADIWIVNPHDNQAINAFSPGNAEASIARQRGVMSVQRFQGGFLDLGQRRVWVIAWPSDVPPTLLNGQVLTSGSSGAADKLRLGGWITVSRQIAAERHLGVGDRITLPTPTGDVAVRIAATTTNFGWTPGAIVMNRRDFAQAWGTSAPTALGVDVGPSMSAAAVRAEIQRQLGADSGLEVLSARERTASIEASASEGLSQLGQISNLLVASAILAMWAALGSRLWSGRAWLAALRLDGIKRSRLRWQLLVEVCLMLVAGCLTGAVAGLYGELVIDSYLRRVTGFPVANVTGSARPLAIFLIVVAAALALAAIPGWMASRVPPTLALEE